MTPILESTYAKLYDSAVAAFPRTTRRQHVTDTIKISGLNVVPFVGMKTLFLRADAFNESHHYRPMILVKGVNYYDHLLPDVMEIVGSHGKKYYLERPSLTEKDVLVRCECGDFFWRFNYCDHLDKSLYGRKRKQYEATSNRGSVNPMQMPGVCKHLMKFLQTLHESGFFAN